MLSNLSLYFWAWVALTLGVAALALSRVYVAREEVDSLYLREGESPAVLRQAVLAHRLNTIDTWGKLLQILAVTYGRAIVCGAVYGTWQESTRGLLGS